MLSKLITLLFLLIVTQSMGQTTTALDPGTGDWSEDNSWSDGIPESGNYYNIIIIPTGVYIEIDVTVDLINCPAINIIVEAGAEIHFQTGKKLKLSYGSTIFVDTSSNNGTISSGNGNGNSNYIEIGGDVVWSADDPDFTGGTLGEPPVLLGVGLTSYNATIVQVNDVVIEWETYFETNNSHFEIERKLGNENWTTIDIVNGGMNTESANYYRYVDYNLAYGQYYYRVTQFDNDGQSTVFGIKSIKIGDEAMYIVSKYNVLGEKVGDNYSGIVIVLYSNGTTEKVFQ